MVKLNAANNCAHTPTAMPSKTKQNSEKKTKKKKNTSSQIEIFSANLRRAAAIALINVRFRISC